MLRVAVLDDYQGVALEMADWGKLGPDAEVTTFSHHFANEDDAAAALHDADVVCLMRERTAITRTLIMRLPRLKFITVTGGRVSVIDFVAAQERGIIVSHTGPGGGSHAASELTMALILACARNLTFEERSVRAGGWQRSLGILLNGKTLGLLGLGRLGASVARLGHAFGMRTIAWSQNLTDETATAAATTRVGKDELFATADVLSIHLVLGPRTRGLVGARELGLMKPTAILINTSRGPIVDEVALVTALRERRIRAAGLDVYDQEPLPADHPLRGLDNAVLSPHIGFVVEEGYRGFYADTVEDILAWQAGKPIRVLTA